MDEYIQRINQAVDYIHKNLDKNLTAEEIADYCCFSRFYFSRMFKAVLGEGVYSFIKRKKLENAAFLLRNRTCLSVTDIALQCGYSPSNFASVFKEHFGIRATEYRKNRDIVIKEAYSDVAAHLQELRGRENAFDLVNSKIEIRRIGEMNLLYDRFIGNYYDLSNFWSGFCEKSEEKGLINDQTRFVGISYDDPLITDENRCIYDVCISVENMAGPGTHRIEEGYYACYRFSDNLANLGKAYHEIFAVWLPHTQYPVDNRLPLEIYKTAVDADGNVILDICLPVVLE